MMGLKTGIKGFFRPSEYGVPDVTWEPDDERVEGSSLRQGTSEVSGMMIFFILLSVVSLVLGGVFGLFGISGILAAIVLALFARIAQSGRQHQEMMDELRRR